MNRKCMVKSLVAIAVVLLLATAGMAQDVISVNFIDNDALLPVGVNTAGVVPAGNWNDLNFTTSPILSNLKDDSGELTTAQAEVLNGTDVFGGIGTAFGNAGDDNLMKSHLYMTAATSPTSVAITDIPYAEYDLYVYYNASQTGTITFTIRGTAYSLTGLDQAGADTDFVIADPGNSIPGNYVVFEGLTASDVTIDANPGTNPYSYMNGFQIVGAGGAKVYRVFLPDPANGDDNVPAEQVLSWIGPSGVADLTYDVYLVQDPNIDPNNPPDPVAAGITDEFYDPDPDLILGRTYYWRVDLHGLIQDPNLPYDPENPYDYPIDVTGNLWSFSTLEPPTLGPTGEVISVNLIAGGASVGTQTAGVVPVENWNDYPGTTDTMYYLKNDLGFSTYTNFSFGGGIAYTTGPGMVNPGDNALLSGHIYNPGVTVSGTFIDIPYDAYDLYVYYNSGAVNNTQTFSIRGTSISTQGYDVAGIDTAFVDSQNGTVNGNYVVFKALTLPDIIIDANPIAGSYTYMNGYQIVSSWNPQPADGKMNVSTAATLSWRNPIMDIADVTYDLYLQKDDPSIDPNTATPAAAGLTAASYNPDPDLDKGGVYYWLVVMNGMTQDPNLPYDPENPYDYPVTRTSPVWSFTTAGKASEPFPMNDAIEVDPNAILAWQGLEGYKHDVYFGTDETAVANADVTDVSGIYQGRQDVTEITFDPYGLTDMDWATTYYWRIDEVVEGTPDTILLGDVWSFTTVVPQCPTPLRGDTNNDCVTDLQDLANMAASWLSCALVPEESCPF